MALTELEQAMLNSLQSTQKEQIQTINDLQKSQQEQQVITESLLTQISDLSKQVDSLNEAYNTLAQVYSYNEESE